MPYAQCFYGMLLFATENFRQICLFCVFYMIESHPKKPNRFSQQFQLNDEFNYFKESLYDF